MRVDRAANRLKVSLASSDWLTFRHEDSATDLEGTLRRICGFCNVDFEPAMLSPDPANFHGLGGNRLRKRPIERITMDAAWRTEMASVTLVLLSLFSPLQSPPWVSKLRRRISA